MKNNTIFVQIASYRDPQLIPTLKSLISNAKHPENLHVGICWQHGEDEPSDIFLDDGFIVESFTEADGRVHGLPVLHITHPLGTKLSVIDVHYFDSKGCCWARNSIQQLYGKEKYTLQLDSHHRFIDGWDDVLIEMLEGLRDKSPKPLLTANIPSFDPDNDPAARVQEPWVMDFDRFIPEGTCFFLPRSARKENGELDAPTPARFYSAHFAFADGSFAEEVQHDPELFFHSEEQSIATRAYTHGYDLYHPNKVIAWHEYTRKARTKVWDDHTTAARNKGKTDLDWVQRNDLSHRRNRILFGMDGEDPNQIDFGKYGFGTERTVLEYEQYAGISFKYRGVQQRTVDGLPPPGEYVYQNEEQWKSTFVGSHDIRILVHRDELKWPDGELPDDMDFWYLGSADDDLNEVFRKDVQASDIKNYLKNEWTDIRLIWKGEKVATKYVVWPHSTSKGWGNRIVKDVPPLG